MLVFSKRGQHMLDFENIHFRSFALIVRVKILGFSAKMSVATFLAYQASSLFISSGFFSNVLSHKAF